MALPSSGQMSLSNVRAQFGGSEPVRMSDYYQNALQSNLTQGVVVAGVPAVGSSISLSNFYGSRMPQFPPANLAQGYAPTLTGLAYGNGTYNITATVERNGGGTAAHAYNTSGLFWQINPFTNPTTTLSGTGYVGDYVQIEMPQAIRVLRYVLTTAASNNPLEWAIGGSMDGTTWTLVDYRTHASIASFTTFTYQAQTPGVFRFLRFVYIRSSGFYPTLSGLRFN